MTNFKFFSAWEDFALCRNVCYIHINHTVNKEREVKIWLISKLSTKNGITVSYTANEVWTLKRKMWLKSKRNVAQKSIFLFSPWAPAWRKLMLRVGEANFNGWRMIFKIHFSLSCTGEGNGNPLQCSCLENPGKSQGQGSLVGCHLWGRTELDTTEAP